MLASPDFEEPAVPVNTHITSIEWITSDYNENSKSVAAKAEI